MSIEDKLAIQEIIAQYSYTYDGKDAEGFAQLFVEDGVFEVFVPGKTTASLRLHSRTEILEWATQRLRERTGRFTSRHFQSGLLFDELTSDSALTRTMVLVTHQGVAEAAPRPTISGCITTNGARHTRDGGSRTGPHMLTEIPVFRSNGAGRLRRAEPVAAVFVPPEHATLAERAPGLEHGAVLHLGELPHELVEGARTLAEERGHPVGHGVGRHW